MSLLHKRSVLKALAVTSVLGMGSFGILQAQAKKSKDPTPHCKISPLQAIAAATQKVHGRAINANFELDEGKWIYGVMVVSGKTIKEVQVDPMTGKAGDVESVTPEEEAIEIRDELTKAIGGKVVQSKKKMEEEDEKEEKSKKR